MKEKRLVVWPEMAQYDFLGRVLFMKLKAGVIGLVVALLIFAAIEESITRWIEMYPRTPVIQLGDILWDSVLVPIFVAYYALSYKRIPDLAQHTIATTRESNSGQAIELIGDLKHHISSWRWPALAFVLSLLGEAALYFGTWQRTPPGFFPWLAHVAYSLTLGTLVLYAGILMLFREMLLVRWLGRYFRSLRVKVRPLHPDNAGGFDFLGKYYLNLALLAVVGGMMISLWSVLVPTLQGTAVLTGPVWSLAWVGYAILAPSIFFLPLRSGHEALKTEKTKLLAEVSKRFDLEFEPALGQANGAEPIISIATAAESFEQLHEFVQRHYPAWPFSSQVRNLFSLSWLLPIATSVLSWAIDLILKS